MVQVKQMQPQANGPPPTQPGPGPGQVNNPVMMQSAPQQSVQQIIPGTVKGHSLVTSNKMIKMNTLHLQNAYHANEPA